MPYYCPDWLCVDSDECEENCEKCFEPKQCSCIRCVLYDTCYPKE